MRLRTMMSVALLASTMSLIAAAPASADSGIDGSSTSATTTATSATTASDASSSKPADTSSTAKPTTTSSTPKPTTTSSTPTTTTTTPCTDSGSSSSGPVCQEGPTPTPETPKTPETPDNRVPEVPGETPRGGGDLPFTGPGDVLLAVLLAMLGVTGGLVLLAGATGREQIETLNRRTMASPSGFKLQYREVLKQLVD